MTADAPQHPPIGGLAGLKLAKKSRVLPVFYGQDKVPCLGRRIIATQSLYGDNGGFSVPDTNPANPQTHPGAGTERVVLRARADITPGHFLRLSVVYVPSGFASFYTGAEWVDAAVEGSIRVNVTWHDQAAATETVEYDRALAPSVLANGAAPSDPWAGVRVESIDLISPDLVSAADWAQWTRHVGADVIVYNVGGARIVDAVLHEVPLQIGREVDDAADLWTSHIYSVTQDGQAGGPTDWPFERWKTVASDGDPRGGCRHLLDAANAQGLRLGPTLVHWTAFTETDADVTAATNPVVSTTSSSFVRLWDGASVTYSTSTAGWSLACGAYARNADKNHSYWSAENGAIPVLVCVRGYVSSGTGYVRIQSDAYSYIDVTITTTSDGWTNAYGHLRTGIGPGDDSVCVPFFRTDSAVTLNVSSLCVYRVHSGYAPTF